MPGWFRTLKGKPRPVEILGFDVEGCGGPGGFVCGSIVGEVVNAFYTDRESMFKDLLYYARNGAWVFAHNLQYDLPILEGDKFPTGDLLFTRDRLLWADFHFWERRVRLFDSTNLFPRHSVAALGELVCYPKEDLSPYLLQQLSAGKRWEEFHPVDQEQIRKYNLRDAQIVYMAVSWLQEVVLSLGGQLQATIAGVAMDLFRRVFHKWPWVALGPKTNNFARPGFYGGRVENFAAGKVPNVNMYDITSLYPFAQHETRFPHPNHTRIDPDPGVNGEFWKGEGMIRATVQVPEQFIPVLPLRYDKRLFFPFGELTGMWCINELRRALEVGVKLKSVEVALWSPVVFNPFTEFIETLFARRFYYLSQGSTMANIVKLILNSLFGRWGLNPDGGLYKLVDMEHAEDLSKFQGFITQDINGRLFGYGPIQSRRFPDYVNVLFAGQISAQARIILLNELLQQNEDSIYCDTDSIITRGDIKTGNGLGEWREEMHSGEVDLIGPKEYAIHYRANEDKYIVKGVPESVARDYFLTGVARFYKALNIREAIQQGKAPAVWVETFKGRRDAFPKRYPLAKWQLEGRDYTPTRPYAVWELPLVTLGAYYPGEFDSVYPDSILLPEQPQVQGSMPLLL
jgi:hypothetical protein